MIPKQEKGGVVVTESIHRNIGNEKTEQGSKEKGIMKKGREEGVAVDRPANSKRE